MIWLFNLLLINDKRGLLTNIEDVAKIEEEFFLKKITGYVSYLKSSNLSGFPTRLYPSHNLQYYRKLINGEYQYSWDSTILKDKEHNEFETIPYVYSFFFK